MYAQNFGSGEKWVPAKVVKVLGPHSCQVELLEDKCVWHRHIENLRHHYVEDSFLTADAPTSTAPRTPVEYLSFPVPNTGLLPAGHHRLNRFAVFGIGSYIWQSLQ